MVGASFVVVAAFDVRPVPTTNSSLNGDVGASCFVIAFGSYSYCTMSDTNSSFPGIVGASFVVMIAALIYAPCVPKTKYSFHDDFSSPKFLCSVVASFMIAFGFYFNPNYPNFFLLSSMPSANPLLFDGVVGACFNIACTNGSDSLFGTFFGRVAC